jgi:beta-N-acetylhexosaminidase
MRYRTVAVALGALLIAGSVTGCVTGAAPSGTPTPRPSGSATPSTPDPIAGLSLAQQVGQVFMVGTTATAAQPVTLGMIAGQHVGNVFLSGRSTLGVQATASVVASLRAQVNAASTDGVPLFVATDQEGGQVQVLRGPGFDTIPTGVGQGQLSPAALQAASQRWGAQLKSAGVNMDLAPVVDLVGTPAAAPANPPIGAFQRELGFSPTAVVAHADAFRAGLATSGVQTVIKHFPGLGFVNANTDTTAGVTDTAVTATGADVGIYKTQIASGARYIMVSSAIYQQIDPSSPGVFSHALVTGLLRQKLGFSGVIVTDDLSGAVQVEYLSPADRAIDAIEAGVDIVLVSKDPTVGPVMVAAVLAKAQSDPSFAKLVATAARRVVTAKREGIPATQ